MKKYRFFNKKTGKWEDVSPEKWQWEAHYSDGQILKQFDDSGIFHQFVEIDQDRLFIFKMVSPESRNSYTLFFSPQTMKLIHFYRRVVLNAKTQAQQELTLYCFGYQRGHERVIMCILPNDELIITDDIAKIRVGSSQEGNQK